MSRATLLLVALLCLLLTSPIPAPVTLAQDMRAEPLPRPEVDARFRDYVQHRGGARTIGLPLSEAAQVDGRLTQIFQRRALQIDDAGVIRPSNLGDLKLTLDNVNGSVLPPLDASLADTAPPVGEPDYHARALKFVRDHVPDEWNGMPVGFYRTFTTSVRAEEAAPGGRIEQGVLEGLDLELWGLPTSLPATDPANAGFVYQRFQRGIMHYDSLCDCTQGLHVGDKLLALLPAPQPLAAIGASGAGLPGLGPLAFPSVSGPTQGGTGDGGRRPIVVVDPGHGGSDSGAMRELADGSVVTEKEQTLRIASGLIPLLSEAGVTAVPTRMTDLGMARLNVAPESGRSRSSQDLQARVDLANAVHADLLLSIHINSAENAGARGVEVIYSEGRPQSGRSRAFAELANRALVQSLRAAGYPAKERKVVTDSAVLGGEGHFYLLGPASEAIRRATQMPAVIGETLFLSNDEDLTAIVQPAIQNAIARGYAEAIKQYFARFPVR